MMPEAKARERYKVKVSPGRAWSALISAYDLDLRLRDRKSRIEVGRFSFGLVSKLHVLQHPDDELLFRAGSFCECGNSTILVGGEHRNDKLFNTTFAGSSVFRYFMSPEAVEEINLHRTRPTVMGDNVVISERAVVLSGTQIGDGCVVGANALARGSLEPYGVYAGVPARLVKSRFPLETQELHRRARLQDIRAHAVPNAPVTLAQLQSGALSVEDYERTMPFLQQRPRLIVEVSVSKEKRLQVERVLDYFVGDRRIEDAKPRALLDRYFAQANETATDLTWCADVFEMLGLYDD